MNTKSMARGCPNFAASGDIFRRTLENTLVILCLCKHKKLFICLDYDCYFGYDLAKTHCFRNVICYISYVMFLIIFIHFLDYG